MAPCLIGGWLDGNLAASKWKFYPTWSRADLSKDGAQRLWCDSLTCWHLWSVTVLYWRIRHPKDPAKLNTKSTTHCCVFMHWNVASEKRRRKVTIIKSNINLLNQISQKTASAEFWGFFCLNLPPTSNIKTHFPKPYKWGFLSNVTTYSPFSLFLSSIFYMTSRYFVNCLEFYWCSWFKKRSH